MEQLETAQSIEEERESKPKVGHPPIKERSIKEIVSRLPGKLTEQSETKGSKTTYIVKFASEDSDELTTNMFEVLDSKTGTPQIVSPSGTAKRGGRLNVTTKTHEVDTSIARSKRIIKTPKRLLDTDSNLVMLRQSPALDVVSRKGFRRNVVLELPEISICKIDEEDLYIEVIVNSEFTVGPLELKEEENGKSKYSCRVSGIQMICEDSQSKVDSFNDSQLCENESVSVDSLTKQVQDDAHILTTPVKEPKNKQSLHPLIKDANYQENLPKKQMKNKRTASPRKKITKSQKDDNIKMESSAEIYMESSVAKQNNEKVEVDMNTTLELKTENQLTDSLEDTCDSFDDLDSEFRDMDEVENQSLAQPHAASDIADDIKVKSEHKESQMPEPITVKKDKGKIKTKKAEIESRPKRKYTKRNAYSHDNTNYTVTTNETGLNIYKCSLCGLEIQYLGNMRDHIRSHTGSRPFKCEQCGKTFANQNNYNKHIVLHSDERPHVCDICGMDFKVKRQLTLHVNRHTSKGSKICQICGKSFHSTTELKHHFDTHQSEKHYKCDVCGKLFSHASSLNRHKLIHKGGALHQCHICGDKLTRRLAFKNHLLKVHNIPKETVESMAPKLKGAKHVATMKEKADFEQENTPDENVVTIRNVPFIIGGEPVYIHLDDTNFEIQYFDTIDGMFAPPTKL